MTDGYTGWFDGWQNARQRRAIQGLEGQVGALSRSLSRQQQQAAALRQQLSQVRGGLEQKVDRLAQSLQALVELGDLRQVLVLYDAPALVRQWSRETLTAMDAGEPLPAGDEPADVPGYWLGPAVRALRALASGVPAGDPELAGALAAARQRDPARSGLLLCLGLALTGRGELALPWLPDAFGELVPGRPVTVAQRALWTAMAVGGFGPTGAELLRQRLDGLLDRLDRDQRQAEAAAWAAAVDALPASVNLRSLGQAADPAVQRCLEAGTRLAALRELCTPDPGPAPAGPAGAVLDATSRELLTGAMHSLVDEGTPVEAPLLRRAQQLRTQIEAGGVAGAAPPPDWDDEAGDPCQLLRQDAFDRTGPVWAASRTALAQQAGRRWLLAAASRLADTAGAEAPGSVTVRVAGRAIPVGPAGADSWELARVRTEIEQQPVVDVRYRRRVLAAETIGGAMCAAVIAWPNGLAVLSVLIGLGLVGYGAAGWFREREARAQRIAGRDADLARVESLVGQATRHLAERRKLLAETARRAGADLAALRLQLDRTR